MTTFPTPDPIRARIDLEVGDVLVATGPVGETVVHVVPTDPSREQDVRAAEETRVTCADGRLEVVGPRRNPLVGPSRKSGSVQVTVRLPERSAVEARTALGVVTADGSLGELAARTGAGDVRVRDAASADLKTGMGAVTAGRITGDARCSTGSGSIRIDQVRGSAVLKNSNGDTWIGDAGPATRIKAANGRITVDRARGDLTATTANGDLRVGCVERGAVVLRTSLGSVELGVPHGTAARLGLHTSYGAVRSHLDPADGPGDGDLTVDVDVQTSAGDIDIVRAVVPDER